VRQIICQKATISIRQNDKSPRREKKMERRPIRKENRGRTVCPVDQKYGEKQKEKNKA